MSSPATLQLNRPENVLWLSSCSGIYHCLAKGDNKMEEEIMRPSRPTSEPELFSFYASFCCEDTVCLEKAQGYHNKA